MVRVEQVDAGTIVSGYVAGVGDQDRVLMADRGRGRTEPRFTGDFTSWEVGGLAGCDVTSEGPTTTEALCRWRSDVHIVGALVEGSATYADGKVRRSLPSSTVVAYPGNAAFTFDFDDVFRYAIIAVTPDDLGTTRGGLERFARGRVIEPSPFASALTAILGEAAGWSTRTPTGAADLGEEVRGLLRRMIRLSDEEHFGVGADRRHAQVLEWIEEHLSDQELDPAQIAAAQHISVRQLHRLFAELGVTCRRHIVRRRLERVRAELVATDLPLAAIGTRWGFVDPAYLSKAFRAEYGFRPLDVRRHRA